MYKSKTLNKRNDCHTLPTPPPHSPGWQLSLVPRDSTCGRSDCSCTVTVHMEWKEISTTLPHSPIATTVSSFPLVHASTSRLQLFGYVWPSDPQTGRRISGQISLQTHVAMPSTTLQWCRGCLHNEMSQGSVGT